MKRREFLKAGSQAVLGPFVASMASAVAPRLYAGVNNSVKPYGATVLEDTNLHALENSLRQQLNSKNMLPRIFDLFPNMTDLSPAFDPKVDSVVGEAKNNPFLDKMRFDLTVSFPGQTPCTSMALRTLFKAYRIFVGLHEATHPVALHTKREMLNLNEYVFNKINKIEGQKPADYLSSLLSLPAGRDGDRYLVAEATLNNVPERLADTSAALYILSNYSDIAGSIAFLEKIIDLRQARYMNNEIHPVMWLKNNTMSSIKAAIENFTSDPHKGLAITETPQLAANIIITQPEFTQSIEEIAKAIVREINARSLLFYGPENRTSRNITARLTPKERGRQQDLMQDMIDARGRACIFTPVL